MKTTLSTTKEDVLALIEHAESQRKYIWTAGRVLQALGEVRHNSIEPEERKQRLELLKHILKQLEKAGHLERRSIPQSIGFGDEVGYDYTPR